MDETKVSTRRAVSERVFAEQGGEAGVSARNQAARLAARGKGSRQYRTPRMRRFFPRPARRNFFCFQLFRHREGRAGAFPLAEPAVNQSEQVKSLAIARVGFDGLRQM